MNHPYDSPFTYTGYMKPVIAFLADLPAFLAIGRRSAALSEAALRLIGKRSRMVFEFEPGKNWRDLVAEAEPAAAAEQARRFPSPTLGDPRIGRFRVECGHRKEITAGQRALFDWLEAHQAEVVETIRPALLDLYQQSAERLKIVDWDSDLKYPDDITDEEKLDRLDINHFELDDDGREICIDLETEDMWFSEHGCSIVLRDGKLFAHGCWDDIENARHVASLDADSHAIHQQVVAEATRIPRTRDEFETRQATFRAWRADERYQPHWWILDLLLKQDFGAGSHLREMPKPELPE